MLGQRFAELVEDCLQRLDRGEDLAAVLSDHPDYEERLKPLLLVAMAGRALPIPIPNQTAQRFGRHHLLAEMSQMQEQGTFLKSPQVPPTARVAGRLVSAIRERGLTSPSWNFRLAMVAMIMVFSAGLYTLNASASGLSGGLIDFLRSGYSSFVQMLGFYPDDAGDFNLGPFHFFNGGAISFEEKIASKAVLLLDLENGEHAASAEGDLESEPDPSSGGVAAVVLEEDQDQQEQLPADGDQVVEDVEDKDKEDKDKEDKDKEDKDKEDKDKDDKDKEDTDQDGDEDGDEQGDEDGDEDGDDQGEDED